jgi:hypothetical protein
VLGYAGDQIGLPAHRERKRFHKPPHFAIGWKRKTMTGSGVLDSRFLDYKTPSGLSAAGTRIKR